MNSEDDDIEPLGEFYWRIQPKWLRIVIFVWVVPVLVLVFLSQYLRVVEVPRIELLVYSIMPIAILSTIFIIIAFARNEWR
jgi:hypothetical protein